MNMNDFKLSTQCVVALHKVEPYIVLSEKTA